MRLHELLFSTSSVPGEVHTITACIGIYDDPAHQEQGPIELDLTNGNLMIIGSPQFGKTTALQTIIRSLSERYTSEEVNLYILDFASMILTNFESLLHIGGIAIPSQEEKVRNLFKMLLGELSARKRKMLKAGVSSFAAYLDTGKKDLPQIVLILSNFTAFREIFEAESEVLLKLCREGSTAGISVIIANATTSGLGYKYMANFAHRIAFFCHDSGEYSTLFDYCRTSLPNIPGRALIRQNNELLELQTYQAFDGEREMEKIQAVREYIAARNQHIHTKAARIIPVVPELIADRALKATQPNLFASPYQIPIGMNYASMEYESIHLLKTGALGICGREGMGRTNLVMHILHTLQQNILQHDVEAYVVDDLNQRLQLSESYGCVVRYTINATDAVEIVEELYETLQSRKEAVKAMGVPVSEAVKEMPLLLLILSGSDAVQMLSAKSAIQEKLMALTKDFVPYRSCVIVTGIANEKVSYSGPAILKALLERGPVFLFEDVNNIRLLDITNSQKNRYQAELKPGDSYLWQNAKLSKIRTIYHEQEQ